LVNKESEDNEESSAMLPPSNGAQISGFAGDFVPKLEPEIVIVLPWLNVPDTEDTDGAAKADTGNRSRKRKTLISNVGI